MRLGFGAINQLHLEAIDETCEVLVAFLGKGDRVEAEDWQKGVLRILQALIPQYVAVLPKTKIKGMRIKR